MSKTHMKNLFYSAADKIGQKPDGILYRLPTGHQIYSMPFGQSENLIYSPVRAEYLIGGISRRLSKRLFIYSPVLVRFCRALAGGKRIIKVLAKPSYV